MSSSGTNRQAARLIVDPPAAGAWNMAIDQALLESTGTSGIPVLRFYQWTPATLSLGYFQRSTDRDTHLHSHDCPVVRRSSGGGAILHDHDLTYSLCLPIDHVLARDNLSRYNQMHLTIAAALSAQGIETKLFTCDESCPPKATAADPFLCFQRRAIGDLICGEAKIGGSATRRTKTAVLQHGSLLLRTSACAPELRGIYELTGIEVDY